MAYYNLSSALDVFKVRKRIELLIKNGAIIDLTEKKPPRTVNQNKYLHVCLHYFASQAGMNNVEYVKKFYYKLQCNSDLFIRRQYDKFLKKEVIDLRSSADLTTAEMSLSIDRFRNWADIECGIPIPDARLNPDMITAMEIEIEKCRQYLWN